MENFSHLQRPRQKNKIHPKKLVGIIEFPKLPHRGMKNRDQRFSPRFVTLFLRLSWISEPDVKRTNSGECNCNYKTERIASLLARLISIFSNILVNGDVWVGWNGGGAYLYRRHCKGKGACTELRDLGLLLFRSLIFDEGSVKLILRKSAGNWREFFSVGSRFGKRRSNQITPAICANKRSVVVANSTLRSNGWALVLDIVYRPIPIAQSPGNHFYH